MEEKTNVDRVRRAALERIVQDEKRDRFWNILVVWAINFCLIVTFYLLADFSNRLHVLLLVSSLAILTMVFGGIMALEKYVERKVQLILKAIELVDSRQAADPSDTP
jgi:hypothetical protein